MLADEWPHRAMAGGDDAGHVGAARDLEELGEGGSNARAGLGRGARDGLGAAVLHRDVLVAQDRGEGARVRLADRPVTGEEAIPRDLVGGVDHDADARHEVAVVRGLEVADAAVLDERDVAHAQLDLEQVAVRAGAHEDRLVLEVESVAVRLEHRVGDLARLVVAVEAGDEAGLRSAVGAVGHEGQLATRAGNVGEVEDLLRGAEVAFKEHRGRMRELLAQRLEVLRVGAPEAVDRLRVIAHHGEPLTIGTEQPHDVDLYAVDVLVLVDEHVVPPGTQASADVRVGEQGTRE